MILTNLGNFQMVRTYENAEILDSRVEKVLAYILILSEKVRETSETQRVMVI